MDAKMSEPVVDLLKIIDGEDKILIYGAGYIADMLYRVLKYFKREDRIEAFIVKETGNNPALVRNITVKEYGEYINGELKILIGLTDKSQDEVYEQLSTAGIDKERIIRLDENTLQGIRHISANTFCSADYWNQRYVLGGNSGPGSYNRLAEFKAEIINNFVKVNDIQSVIEWGCGDGNQLGLACYPHYIGFDVSQKAVEICEQKYKDDADKVFIWCGDEQFVNDKSGELVLSLDVIFHLIEDKVFDAYMERLFRSSEKYVCIYSSNCDLKAAQHVRHRKFTDWIENNIGNEWRLINVIRNKYPYDVNDTENTSMSDFYIYERS